MEITGGVSITGYSGGGGDLVIPSTLGGKPVLEIGSPRYNQGVFENKGITSVVIPAGMRTIGTAAFAHNQLTFVIIPNSVITIWSHAFANNQTGFVVIPDSVTHIGYGAFSYNQLTSVT
ncbi:MAG: leucine-rich repeat domain-containing protein, partial [Firmicutes bacterium]|nr:leucine-rich repeat domain-containing protein [Bacillota bacterium]